MKKCNSCGAELLESAKFCTECGQEVIEMEVPLLCPECGEEVKMGDAFCMNCGAELNFEKILAERDKKEKKEKEEPVVRNIEKKKRGRRPSPKNRKKGEKKGWPLWAKVAVAIIGFMVVGNLIPWELLDDKDEWSYEEVDRSYGEEVMEESPEYLAAKEEYQAAFEKYTNIATGNAEGDIEEALKDYKEKYARYKGLEAGLSAGSSGSDQPVVSTIAQEESESEVLTLSDGARIALPKRTTVFNDSLSWTSRGLRSDEVVSGYSGKVYVFESFDLFKIKGKTRVELPIGEDVKSLWFKGSTGIWIPLNYENKTVENGRVASVVIDEEPTPWEIAGHKGVFDIGNCSPALIDLYRFEQAMVQDRASLEGQISSIMRGVEQTSNMGFSNSIIQSDPAIGMINRLVNLWKLFRIVDHGKATESNWDMYFYAMGQLTSIKTYGKLDLTGYQLNKVFYEGVKYEKNYDYLKSSEELWDFRSSGTAADWLRKFGAAFAPWGIDLTNELIKIVDAGSRAEKIQFLTCLDPIGGKNTWVDIKLKNENIPEIVNSTFFSRHNDEFHQKYLQKSALLRIYAPRSVNMTWFHWFFKKLDQFLRYAPPTVSLIMLVLSLFGVTIISSFAAPSTLAYIFLMNTTWAAAEWYTEDYAKAESSNTEVHERMNYVHTATQNTYKTFTVTAGKKLGIKIKDRHLRLGLASKDLDGPEMVLSLICAFVLDIYQDGEMERLMKINNERLSYLGRNLPPITILASMSGKAVPKNDRYSSYMMLRKEFHLNMNAIYKKDWAKDPLLGGENETQIDLKSILGKNNGSWRTFAKDEIIDSYAPQRQLIRVNLSKALLNWRLTRYTTDALKGKTWKSVEFKDLDLWIHIRSLSGDFSKFKELKEVTKPVDLNNDRRASIISLDFEDMEIGAVPVYPDGFFADNLFHGGVGSVNYSTEKTHARREYLVDVGYKDRNGHYVPISTTVKLDFSNALDQKIKTKDKGNVLSVLKDNRVAAFFSEHRSLSDIDPIYIWHIVNTEPLKPKERDVVISGHTITFGSTPFPQDDPNKTVVLYYGGKRIEKISDQNGLFSITVPCSFGSVVVEGQGEKKTVSLEGCPEKIEIELGNKGIVIEHQVSTVDTVDLPPIPDDPEMDKILKEQMEEMKKWGDEQRKKNKQK